ncbi:MAG: winged helix-turn-helix domain-containing protein, partial [Caldilineaceae bacterium]|nr:winged helix-turn-helix domain-containing protein [Caldilineaceae bacterium]
EMANRLGTVREVVGRTLRALAGDGIIAMERQHIVVVDRERLAKEAEI